MVKQAPIQVKTAQAGCPDKLARNVHQTVVALDSELGSTVDWRYREQLVKATYALRNLQELIQRDSKLAEHSRNSELRR